MCAAVLFSRESGQDGNPHFRLPLILVIWPGEKNPWGNVHFLTWKYGCDSGRPRKDDLGLTECNINKIYKSYVGEKLYFKTFYINKLYKPDSDIRKGRNYRVDTDD